MINRKFFKLYKNSNKIALILNFNLYKNIVYWVFFNSQFMVKILDKNIDINGLM
jgi:hypothetical protein